MHRVVTNNAVAKAGIKRTAGTLPCPDSRSAAKALPGSARTPIPDSIAVAMPTRRNQVAVDRLAPIHLLNIRFVDIENGPSLYREDAAEQWFRIPDVSCLLPNMPQVQRRMACHGAAYGGAASRETRQFLAVQTREELSKPAVQKRI